MKPILLSVILNSAFLIFNSSAGTILQEQANFAGIFQAPAFKGQTFLAEDPILRSIGVSLHGWNGRAIDHTVNLSLFAGRGTNGSLLAQRSMSSTVYQWMDFDVTGVAVVPGETYTFIIQSPTYYWGADYNAWASEPNGYVDPDSMADRVDYTGGEMLTDRGFQRYLDLTFRVIPIPEPSTVLLLLAGLAFFIASKPRLTSPPNSPPLPPSA